MVNGVVDEKHEYHWVVGDYLIDYAKIRQENQIVGLHGHNCSQYKLYYHC